MPLGGYIKALAPWCLSSPSHRGQLGLPTREAAAFILCGRRRCWSEISYELTLVLPGTVNTQPGPHQGDNHLQRWIISATSRGPSLQPSKDPRIILFEAM